MSQDPLVVKFSDRRWSENGVGCKKSSAAQNSRTKSRPLIDEMGHHKKFFWQHTRPCGLSDHKIFWSRFGAEDMCNWLWKRGWKGFGLFAVGAMPDASPISRVRLGKGSSLPLTISLDVSLARKFFAGFAATEVRQVESSKEKYLNMHVALGI